MSDARSADERRVVGAAIVRACRRLDARGLVAGPDGNVSARLSDGSILVTPSGTCKGELAEEALVRVSLDGSVMGAGHPSSELRMHLRVYTRRADVGAVVHAHPPYATALGVAGESLVAAVLPEVILQMGQVPLVPYATPGTDAVAALVEESLTHHEACLMANHGATAVGPTVETALMRMESLEHAAHVLCVARGVGRVHQLRAEDVRALGAGHHAGKDDR